MQNKTDTRSDPAADLSVRARDLAARADALATEIASLHREIRAADHVPVRRAGYRCDTAVGWIRESAEYLRETSADLDRIEAATTPGVCVVQWGACPEHGNTLVSTAGKTWCREWACQRRWDYDCVALPCAEPARWTITDQCGGTSDMCEGHALDAARHFDGARVAPLVAAERKESA